MNNYEKERFDKAIIYVQDNDWDGLLNHSVKWSKDFPNDYRAFYALGLAYDKIGKFEDAFKAYSTSLSINNQELEVLFNYGRVCGILGRHADAIDAFKKVVEFEPEYSNAWYYLAVSYELLEQYDESKPCYGKAIEIDNANIPAWNRLGLLYMLAYGNYEYAIKCFTTALRYDGYNTDVLNNLGIAYADIGEYEKSIEVFKAGLNINPNNLDLLHNLFWSYKSLGKEAEAYDVYERMKLVDPESVNSLAELVLFDSKK